MDCFNGDGCSLVANANPELTIRALLEHVEESPAVLTDTDLDLNASSFGFT